MTTLAAVAYPHFPDGDHALWVAGLRDRLPDLTCAPIMPHFTLIYPLEGIDERAFTQHLQNELYGVAPLRFTLRCALLMPEPDRHYVFLVPDEGFSDLLKLQAHLYQGILAPHRRLDRPVVPHITVGDTSDAAVAARIVDDLNRESFALTGFIRRVNLINCDGENYHTTYSIGL